MNVKDTLESLVERLQATGVRTVFGEPISAGGRTIIPVARIAYGFGSGGGSSDATGIEPGRPRGEGAGGGGGVRAVPAGVVEVTGSETRFVRFDDWRPLAGVAVVAFTLGVMVARRIGRHRPS
jgi:uncharacterized spore protein YtfJ